MTFLLIPHSFPLISFYSQSAEAQSKITPHSCRMIKSAPRIETMILAATGVIKAVEDDTKWSLTEEAAARTAPYRRQLNAENSMYFTPSILPCKNTRNIL